MELQEQLEKERSTRVHLEESHKDLQPALERYQEQVAAAEARATSLADEAAKTKESLSQVKEQLADAHARLEPLEAQQKAAVAAEEDEHTTQRGHMSQEAYNLALQQKAALEDQMTSLQEHLEQETEHYDTLAAAHEDTLELLETLKAEKAAMEAQLGTTQVECGNVQGKLQETVKEARQEIEKGTPS